MKLKFLAAFFFMVCFGIANLFAQSVNDTVIFNTLGHYNFNFTYSGYTPLIDRLGRPYVYLATKELGVVSFDISNTLNPVPVDSQTVASLGNLKATGVAQDSNYLFVSLGDFEGTQQTAGLAIYDISNPASPLLLDRWDSTAFNTGTSSVIWQGNYAYLSAMQKGVVILDIADKYNIKFVSQIIPDTTFGNHTYTYHSRGIFIEGDTLFVADDNGGLRVIDVTNKQSPVEVGKYLSSSITSVAAAYYNHVYRLGNYAYCAVDYCGFEVVDISNLSAMTEASWLNPWSCTNIPPPFGSWNGSDGHCNEIAYSSAKNVLFFAGGDSQVLAFDPSDPVQPRIMGAWGPPNDSVGSWGTDVFGNLVAIANVHTFGFPFVSTIGGLQLLNWNFVERVETNNTKAKQLNLFPNPATDELTINFPTDEKEQTNLRILNSLGQEIINQQLSLIRGTKTVDVSEIPSGIYLVYVSTANGRFQSKKIIISR